MKRLRIESPGPAGRPRSSLAHAAILAAAIELIREVGYDAATMEGISALAGVGKATVYRRWKTREALVAEAITGVVAAIPVPDTGHVKNDLLLLLRATVALYRDPQTVKLLSGLVGAMARSDAIAESVRSGFVAAWSDALRRVLQAGRARCELRRDFDLDLAVDVIGGSFSNRALVTGRPIDERMARALVDMVLRGIEA